MPPTYCRAATNTPAPPANGRAQHNTAQVMRGGSRLTAPCLPMPFLLTDLGSAALDGSVEAFRHDAIVDQGKVANATCPANTRQRECTPPSIHPSIQMFTPAGVWMDLCCCDVSRIRCCHLHTDKERKTPEREGSRAGCCVSGRSRPHTARSGILRDGRVCLEEELERRLGLILRQLHSKGCLGIHTQPTRTLPVHKA